METIIVHCKTEFPRKYVASVESTYSATIPERPVAKRQSLSMLERSCNNEKLMILPQYLLKYHDTKLIKSGNLPNSKTQGKL